MDQKIIQEIAERVWDLFPDMKGVAAQEVPVKSDPFGDPSATDSEFLFQKEFRLKSGHVLHRTVVVVTGPDGTVKQVLRTR